MQLARIKKAKILEKKLFIKVVYALDVKITFPIHCTAGSSRKKDAELAFRRKSYAKPLSLSWKLYFSVVDDVTGLEDCQPRVGFNHLTAVLHVHVIHVPMVHLHVIIHWLGIGNFA